MKVLFYLHPAVLPGGPEFNSGWTQLFGKLLATLESHFPGQQLMVTGSRFSSLGREAGAGDGLRLIDEAHLLAKVREASPAAAVASVFARLARTESCASHPAMAVLASEVRQACGDFRPDLVISFSMPCLFLKEVWPDAVCMTAEAGAFSRSPFPFSLFFDHQGMYRNSGPARHKVGDYRAADASEMLALVRDFRARSADLLTSQDPFSSYGFRDRYERLVLLPLQVCGWYSFDDQAPYSTQFEYLHDVLSTMPREIGVVVSEYIQWGPILRDEGSHQNLQYLRDRFPNLIFHDRFRQYASPSQYLVHHVDGVWTQSSNLGYQALLWGKRLGTTAQTHLRNIAHELTIPAFGRNLLSAEPCANHDDYLAWYLQHYAVPQTFLSDALWLRDYLHRRLVAAREEAQASPASFVATAPAGLLRDAWLRELEADSAPPPQRWRTPTGSMLAEFGKTELKLARSQGQALALRHDSARTPTDGRPRYILLNDTRAIDGALHLGCNVVTEHIHGQMAALGLAFHGCANNAHECQALLADSRLADVRLVVLNGEGSVHHDSARMVELFDFCAHLKQRQGVASVLINSVWHENTAILGERLKCFDLVTVRESASLKAIRAWRSDAQLVPDLSFAAFRRGTPGFELSALSTASSSCAVIDSVFRDRTEALTDFADYFRVPMYLMGRLHTDLLLDDKHWGFREHGHEVFPRILRSPSELAAAGACVTGRFHGLIASLVAGVPTVALPSNTPKVEGLVHDMDLPESLLLDGSWHRLSNPRRMAQVEQRLSCWNEATQAAVSAFVDRSVIAVDRLFGNIGRLLPPVEGACIEVLA